LYRLEHFVLLLAVSLAQRQGPIHVTGHLFEHLGIVRHRLHAQVPGLRVDQVGIAGILRQQTGRGLDIVGVGGRWQDLRN
jgi:hypothetical protein